MEYRCIVHKTENSVATIVLNRPRALNALNEEMVGELLTSFTQVAEDVNVRAVIVTGAGRAFCFGADISSFEQPPEKNPLHSPEDLLAKAQKIIRLLATMPKPTIAALNGFATGLGLDLALACDLRIAADRAKFAEAYVSMGLVPDGGGTFFLPQVIGYAKAAEMIFTGEPIGAPEALQLGLVNRVVPGPELEGVTRQLAEKLARGPFLAISLAKRILRENSTGTLDSALQNEAAGQRICLRSADHMEALEAFRKKRRPSFRGK